MPDVPIRQWVLSVPKRLRSHLMRDSEPAGAVLRVLLRAIRGVRAPLPSQTVCRIPAPTAMLSPVLALVPSAPVTVGAEAPTTLVAPPETVGSGASSLGSALGLAAGFVAGPIAYSLTPGITTALMAR